MTFRMAVLAASTLVAAATSAKAMTVHLRATDLTGDRVYSDPANGLDFELPETLLGSFTYVTPIDPTIDNNLRTVVARHALAGLELGIDGGLAADVSLVAEFIDYDDPSRDDRLSARGTRTFGAAPMGIDISADGLDEALDPELDLPGIDDLNAAGTRAVFLSYENREKRGVQFTSIYETVEFSSTEFAAPVPLPPALLLLGFGLGAIGALGARRRAR